MGESTDPGFTFGLPPSLGIGSSWAMAREFAAVLDTAGVHHVIPFKTYKELQEALLAGEVHAAWGPPLLCARVESIGGTVALRAVRDGAVTYRAALISRARDGFDIESLGAGAFRPRAAWVDESSVAGYLLPRALLRARGIDVQAAFLEQRMLGSYAACIDALIQWESDLTAVFVGDKGLAHTWGDKAQRLKTLALTDESPNDGVVLSPLLTPERTALLVDRLDALIANPHARAVLTSTFDVEGFDRPPKGTYIALFTSL